MVAYSFPGGRMRTLQDHYALNFKTLEKDGVLLYSEGLQGDSIMLELKTGRLYLHISLGRSPKGLLFVYGAAVTGRMDRLLYNILYCI